jgi:hypothetical protein
MRHHSQPSWLIRYKSKGVFKVSLGSGNPEGCGGGGVFLGNIFFDVQLCPGLFSFFGLCSAAFEGQSNELRIVPY